MKRRIARCVHAGGCQVEKDLSVQREVGIVEWVAAKGCAPFFDHELGFVEETSLGRRAIVAAAAQTLMMFRTEIWRPNDLEARITDFEAEVDIVECNRQMLCIEASHKLECLTSDQHSGGSDGGHLLREVSTSGIATFIARNTCMGMSGHVPNSEKYAGVLDGLVRIDELSTNDCNQRIRKSLVDQNIEPVVLLDEDVVIQKQ